MAFARMIMTADDYLHTVCLLFIALGVLLGGGVGGDNESWAPLVHTQSQLPGGDSGKLETH